MKKHLVIIAVLVAVASCKSNKKMTEENQIKKDSTVAICYQYMTGKDTAFIHIDVTGTHFSGEAFYNFYEKDKNSGMLDGMMNGDTLFADYTFISEGTQSVREVAFLKKGNELREGFGDAEEKDGKMVFKNRGTLNFDNKIVLTETGCK